MAYRVLTEPQVEQFIERGYVKVEEAFSRQDALAAQDFLWERLAERGPRKEDPSTWTAPMVHIKEAYSEPVFQACATTRLADAVEDLLTPGRWRGRDEVGHWGWWPVNFAVGADRPWDVPTGGWHWDGQHFRHFIDSPDQGLLLLCMFSEIGPHGGGTLVAEGSHQIVARLLVQRPEGWDHQEALRMCPHTHPWLADLLDKPYTSPSATETQEMLSKGVQGMVEGPERERGPKPEEGPAPERTASCSRVERFMQQDCIDEHGFRLRVAEINASPGDVFLCHPFLYHTASQNHSGIPRFMCNRTTPLKERMRFQRPDSAYSAVEISIRRALEFQD